MIYLPVLTGGLQYDVSVLKRSGTIAQVREKLSTLTAIPVEHLLLVDASRGAIHKFYALDDFASAITTYDDVRAYEVVPPEQPDDGVLVTFYHRYNRRINAGYNTGSYTYQYLMGVPRMLYVNKATLTMPTFIDIMQQQFQFAATMHYSHRNSLQAHV